MQRECRGNADVNDDPGLRRMLTWTFVALVVSLVMAFIGVALAVRFFDRP